jgi:ribosomal protein L7Ae-like RNA K-turn-binding protein
MRHYLIVVAFAVLAAAILAADAADKGNYPPPRFPSYLKPAKSVDDVMPYARAAVRQTGGRTPLGLVEKGSATLIVAEASADPMVMQAIRRAFEERGVKVYIVGEHELLGVSRDDAVKAMHATRGYTAEKGYMEAARWLNELFVDAEVPKKWLKERRPDLYNAIYAASEQASQKERDIAKQFGGPNVAGGIIKFLDEHPDVKSVFWRRGGRPRTARLLKQHSAKFYGNYIFDNRYEVMNKASSFPGDVWRLAEERVLEAIPWADRVEASDPEGTNMHFEVTEEEAKIWASGAYNQGHLFLSPYQATGRFPFSVVDYPAIQKKWNPPILSRVTGVFAGTSNHAGNYPRIEVTVKDGYVTDVKGGGTFGELWREFLKYPGINDLKYPYQDRPGYWWFYEAGLGTNPKFFKRPDELMEGNNQSERNNAGVIHWGFGGSVIHDPDKAEESKAWIDFPKQHGLPKDHWWHIHNTLVTYRLHVRGTKNTWMTVIDKGEMPAYKSPEIRALASRYGDPSEVLAEDWAPYLPGINAPGRYEDYAKDPWKTVSTVIKKIEDGSYDYFYPPVKKKP